jgi:hypothetical protein
MATFEQPLFATIARARPPATRARDTSTGAPTTVERVKTPAAAAGTSLARRARSRFPLGLMPQATPAARKPGTAISPLRRRDTSCT